MEKKYEFTGETKQYDGRVLQRVRRIKDGTLGGWVEGIHNLSHRGECFIYDDAMVYGRGRVEHNATIKDSVVVKDRAKVSNNATVHGYVTVCQDGWVRDSATVGGCVVVSNDIIIGQVYKPYKHIYQAQTKLGILKN